MISNVSALSTPTGARQAPAANLRATQATWTNADSAALLSNLTPQDWAVSNAMAGRTLDHGSAQGEPALPIEVWNIALDRQSGRLSAGQPVTVDYLKNMENGESNVGVLEAINRGIAYLESNLGASSKNATNPAALDVFA